MASSGHLKPGEQGKITVSLDVRGKGGRMSKTVQVFSNDPARPVTVLTVNVFVKGLLR